MSTETETFRSTATGTAIAATAASSFSVQATTLLATFEEQHADWRDGYSIWMGWGPYYLRAEGDGYVVEAPDYGGEATMERTDDLTLALFSTVAMTSVLASANVAPREIGYNDAVLVADGWQEAQMVSLSRSEPTRGDTGWFIEPYEADRTQPWPKEQLSSLPAYQVMQQRPAAIRPLALPPGIAAIVDGDFVRIVVREVDRAVLARGPF